MVPRDRTLTIPDPSVTGVRFPDVVYVRNMFAVKSWSIFELAFGAAALLAFTASLVAIPGGRGLLGGGLALVMIAIARIDARELIIPNTLVLAALALGLCNAGLTVTGWYAWMAYCLRLFVARHLRFCFSFCKSDTESFAGAKAWDLAM